MSAMLCSCTSKFRIQWILQRWPSNSHFYLTRRALWSAAPTELIPWLRKVTCFYDCVAVSLDWMAAKDAMVFHFRAWGHFASRVSFGNIYVS